MSSILVLLVITTASSFVHAGGESRRSNMNCPVVPTVSDLDIEEYASKPWYVQAQLPNRYQPIENLFCVRAVYTITSPTTLDVFNFARKGSVEGEPSFPTLPSKANSRWVRNLFQESCTVTTGSLRAKKIGPSFPAANRRLKFRTVYVPQKVLITCETKAVCGCLRERRKFLMNSSRR